MSWFMMNYEAKELAKEDGPSAAARLLSRNTVKAQKPEIESQQGAGVCASPENGKSIERTKGV
jgi:hypothetical protein